MRHLVISTSLNPRSQSRILARYAHATIAKAGGECDYIDLQDYTLPMCDAGSCYSHDDVQTIQQKISDASGIILATPIYNYTIGSSAKNLIELTGQQWRGKVVGFMCAAGGQGSYMAIMGIANSLMLDFRCIIVPRFVFATEDAFRGDEVVDEAVQTRANDLTDMLTRLAAAVE